MSESTRAYRALTTHRHYAYRGCAPHWDTENLPGRALGDESVPADAWIAPHDEPQKARLSREKAAKAVCAACPVLEACRAYALTEDDDGRLAEPHDIWGGMVSLDRHRALVARRRAAVPVAGGEVPREARTPQKLAVLRALAQHLDPESVAQASGLDVRTANWQRRRLATLFGLDHTKATRGQMLQIAAEAGLLDGVRVVACDGTVPAVPPPSDAPNTYRAPTPEPVTVTRTNTTTPRAKAAPATKPATAAVRVQPAPAWPAVPEHIERRIPLLTPRRPHVPGQLALAIPIEPRTGRTLPAQPASLIPAPRTATSRLEPAA